MHALRCSISTGGLQMDYYLKINNKLLFNFYICLHENLKLEFDYFENSNSLVYS